MRARPQAVSVEYLQAATKQVEWLLQGSSWVGPFRVELSLFGARMARLRMAALG